MLLKRDERKMRYILEGFYVLSILWMFCLTGCSYTVKNDQHRVYSKSNYGEDKFVRIQDLNIHYVEAGEGEPVILIPGVFSTYRQWEKIIPLLSKHYRLVCVDYPGTGDSDKPRNGFKYTIEEQADLIARMIERLKITGTHIVGASYGGAIAFNLAARHPGKVGKVVSIEGNGLSNHSSQKKSYIFLEGLLRWPVLGEIPIGVIRSGIMDRWVVQSVIGKGWKRLPETERESLTEIVSRSNRTASRISWYHLSRTLKTSKNFSDEAKNISIPVLYLYGEDSDYHDMAKENAAFLNAYLPHAEIILIQNGIHDLQLQKPVEVAGHVLEFLGRNRFGRQDSSEVNSSMDLKPASFTPVESRGLLTGITK
jgi:pimeloyl-ACP methyl ester carboxylesterase